jgi:hypothetical protein
MPKRFGDLVVLGYMVAPLNNHFSRTVATERSRRTRLKTMENPPDGIILTRSFF